MDAALGREQPVRVLALGDEGRRLDPRLLARRRLLHLDLEAATLGPAQVHAQQHLGPVLRVGAAGAGADRDDGVAGVVLAAEQPRLLELGEPALDRVELALELGRDPRVLDRELGELLEVVELGEKPRKVASRFCARAWAEDVFAARSWSSQKPAPCISPSSRSISASSAAGSKVVREQGQALRACVRRALTSSFETASAIAQSLRGASPAQCC